MEIVEKHGPRSFAYVGGGGQGCHFDAAFGERLMRALGSRYHYSPPPGAHGHLLGLGPPHREAVPLHRAGRARL
jgi:hypothetical protein